MIPKKDKTRKVTPLTDTSNESDYMTELTNSVIRRKSNKENRIKTELLRNYADSVITSAKEKYRNNTMGLRSILMADASNRPPTLDDYVKLGLSLSQLSETERESIQYMLDKSNLKPEDKK